jgi:hypothetical protein
MQAGVLRVPAFFDQFLRGFVRESDLNQDLLLIGVVLAKVSAEPALAIMNIHHHVELLSW